jgi:hypothetical protein
MGGSEQMRQDEQRHIIVTKSVMKSGIGFGACLAMIISWWRNQSVLWAIIHGLLGWFYVIWYALFLHD